MVRMWCKELVELVCRSAIVLGTIGMSEEDREVAGGGGDLYLLAASRDFLGVSLEKTAKQQL